MPFNQATSLIRYPLPSMSKPTGGGLVTQDLPKNGLLARVWLRVTGEVTGSLSSPNSLGFSSVIRRVRLVTNSSVDIFSVSGPGFSYLLQEALESEYFVAQGQNEGRVAVTATTFNLDMVIPVQINLRDPVGLLMLQNEQTQVSLEIDFEQDSAVATGATVTCTVTPLMEYFTVPASVEDYPPLNTIHQIVEESQQIAGAGELIYSLPRGNTYMQIFHGVGIGVAGSDNFTRFRRRVGQSTFLDDLTPANLDMLHRYLRGRARPAGVIVADFMGSSGLGNYGLTRDFFNSAEVTDYAHIFDTSGVGSLRTVRRQLVSLT